MAVRTVSYAVTANGITPATKQPGGVQGEHNATKLTFNIGSELWDSLQSHITGGGELIYRIDGYDGEGSVGRSDTHTLTQNIDYLLEEWLTRSGGTIKAILVISLLDDDVTEMELYSFPAILQLKAMPNSGEDADTDLRESLSVLAQVAKNASESAVTSADSVHTDRLLTEEARIALESGAEIIFDGGDDEDTEEIEVDLVIDSALSLVSKNPVQNKVVALELSNIESSLADIDDDVAEIQTELEALSDAVSVDFIVEQGTEGIWTYRKWNSGIAECWGTYEYTVPPEGCLADTYVLATENLPFAFTSRQTATITNGYGGIKRYAPYENGDNEDFLTLAYVVCFFKQDVTGNSNITWAVEIKGRWKE